MEDEATATDALRFPMPLMCASFEPGSLEDALASITDPDAHAIAQAESCYFKGQPEEACELAEPYLKSDDLPLRISACFICGYANLSLNRPFAARMCLENLSETAVDARISQNDDLRAGYLLITTASVVLLHLDPKLDVAELSSLAARLPEGLRLFASYVLAHHAYLKGEWGRCVGIVENALTMKQGSYPVSELFCRMVATMGWMSLKEPDKAHAHFMTGWDVASPDGLIEEIGEHHGLLQGMLETCLKDDYPQQFAQIIKITYRFSYGWRRIHNPDAGENVADNLTTTEFTIAMLACRDWTNEEISAHLGVSKGTVKNRLSSVYAKLGISGRASLKDFMLR